MTAIAPPDPPLATDRIQLRPFQPRDAASVAAACQDPTISRYTMMPDGLTEDTAREWINQGLRWWEHGLARFAITAVALGSLHRPDRNPDRRRQSTRRNVLLASRRCSRTWRCERGPRARHHLGVPHPGHRASPARHPPRQHRFSTRRPTLRLHPRRRPPSVAARQERPTRRRHVQPSHNRSTGSREPCRANC